ncbi:fungal specific transcription factor [Colletotrichum incanum]|nr:fungal specific transcription factor [Colletotrichum incanum]
MRIRVTVGDVQCLNERIQQLEDALAQANARHGIHEQSYSDPTPTASISESNAGTIGSPTIAESASRVFSEHFHSPLLFSQTPGYTSDLSGFTSKALQPGSHIGPNWFFRGIHAFSDEGRLWISSKTGQILDWAKLQIFTAKASSLTASYGQVSHELCELPDQNACRECVAIFFQSSLQLTYPVIDPILFEETIDLAYKDIDDVLSSPARLSAQACLFAALSIMAFVPGSASMTHPASYARKSHCILNHITPDATLTTLQTVVMLSIDVDLQHVQRLLGGRWQEAESFLSIACRMVCILGGHIHESKQALSNEISLPNRKARHIRNLFWLCYISDKNLSLRTGQPPLLADIYCDLTLPDNYFSCYTYLRVLEECLHSGDSRITNLTPHFWGDVQLGCLKEKIYRLLYSVHAMNDKDNQLLVHIRQLDDEIECWRLTVPVDFRPALSVSPETLIAAPEIRTPQRKRYFHLLLEYWYLMTFIHTTVRRYDAHTVIGDGSRDLHSVIHSSYDLSLEAGRSTLRCLRVFMKTLSDEDLWFLIFYTTNAAISLFLNIIIHPEEEDGQLDLELLISAANTIRKTKPRVAVPSEGTRIQEHSDFIMWLVWLGSSAITKEGEKDRQHR